MIKITELEHLLPNNSTILTGLKQIFKTYYTLPVQVSIVKRKINPFASTHLSEIIKCNVNKKELTLFLKYEINSKSIINEHRNSLEYENLVYKNVLESIKMSTPYYYGSHVFDDKGTKVVVLEYIRGLAKISKGTYPETIINTVKWLAEFHNKSKKIIQNQHFDFLHKYTNDYYQKWPLITIQRIHELNLTTKFKWLLELTDQYKSQIHLLSEIDQVLVHGEFYPANVRFVGKTIHPLDWQTAAIGSSSVDLATITENWSPVIQNKCINSYCKIRMGMDVNESFEKRLCLARIYICFLWLAYKPKALLKDNYYLRQLKKIYLLKAI